MSTKNLRKALDHYRRLTGPQRIPREVDLNAVCDELEAIEKAAKGVTEWYRGLSLDAEAASSSLDLLQAIARGAP